MSNVMEKVVQRLKCITENKLPVEQYGGRSGYAAPDAVLKLVNYIKAPQGAKKRNQSKRKRTTTAMMIDIKGAFDHVNKTILIRRMIQMGIPGAAIR